MHDVDKKTKDSETLIW